MGKVTHHGLAKEGDPIFSTPVFFSSGMTLAKYCENIRKNMDGEKSQTPSQEKTNQEDKTNEQ